MSCLNIYVSIYTEYAHSQFRNEKDQYTRRSKGNELEQYALLPWIRYRY